MADLKWLKMAIDIFSNRKIRQIERQKYGRDMVLMWFKLIFLAGNINDGGQVYIADDVPYTDESLAAEFFMPEEIVHNALKNFATFGMIEIDNGFIQIKNWEKYQSLDGVDRARESSKKRVQRYRERQQQVCNADVTLQENDCNADCNADVTLQENDCNADCNADVTLQENDCNADCNADVTLQENDCNADVTLQCNADVTLQEKQCNADVTHRKEENRKEENRTDVDEEVDADEDTAGESPPTSCPYAKIMEMYHLLCPSFPTIKNISGERKKFVAARWREFPSLDTFAELFRIAEASSFLKHGNAKWKGADFDWMMKPTNFPRVLEHKYDEDYSVPLPPRDLPKPKQPEPGKLTLGEDSSFDTDEFFTMALKRSYGYDPRETGITYGDNAGGAQ